jgi:hypothetical protein
MRQRWREFVPPREPVRFNAANRSSVPAWGGGIYGRLRCAHGVQCERRWCKAQHPVYSVMSILCRPRVAAMSNIAPTMVCRHDRRRRRVPLLRISTFVVRVGERRKVFACLEDDPVLVVEGCMACRVCWTKAWICGQASWMIIFEVRVPPDARPWMDLLSLKEWNLWEDSKKGVEVFVGPT